MAYTTAEGRQQLLGELAAAADRIALALAALGEAYELLDETTGDRLEEELFGPVQKAYGRAKRAHDDFAARAGLPAGTFERQLPGVASQGVKAFVEKAVAAVHEADHLLAELQDSMLPVEVGDEALRAGLSELRRTLDPLPGKGRGFVRTLGR